MGRKSNAQRAQELIKQLFDKHNYNPVEELIKLAKSRNTKPEMKKQIACEFLQYQFPKQKAVELDQSSGQPVIFNLDLSAGNKPNGDQPDQLIGHANAA